MNKTMKNNKTSPKIKCRDPLNTECSKIIEHPILIEYTRVWDPIQQKYIEKQYSICMECFEKMNRISQMNSYK